VIPEAASSVSRFGGGVEIVVHVRGMASPTGGGQRAFSKGARFVGLAVVDSLGGDVTALV
jgi:hypothetical protein